MLRSGNKGTRMRLLLMRHGETAWNAAGRLQGQSDPPLSVCGQGQALTLAQAVATEAVQAVYSSDLQRARETSHRVATVLGLPVQCDVRWREMAFGSWEGLSWEQIQQHHSVALSAWQADPLHIAPPGGETLEQVYTRVRTALTCLVAAHQAHTVILVSHGGPLRLLLCLALGLPPEAHWRFLLDPGSLSALHLDARGAVLTRLNYIPSMAEGDHAG
jgi:alpha-ribazole phosphatase